MGSLARLRPGFGQGGLELHHLVGELADGLARLLEAVDFLLLLEEEGLGVNGFGGKGEIYNSLHILILSKKAPLKAAGLLLRLILQ